LSESKILEDSIEKLESPITELTSSVSLTKLSESNDSELFYFFFFYYGIEIIYPSSELSLIFFLILIFSYKKIEIFLSK
jgi:hypothetical protein